MKTDKVTNRNEKNSQIRRIRRSSALFIAPSFIGVMIFFVIPFIVIIYYSFINNQIAREFVFLDNYRNVLMNKAFRTAVFNTFRFSFIAVPLAVVFSLILAVMLDDKVPYHSTFRTFFLSPLMVPVASVVLVWQVLFHYHGAVNDIMGWFAGCDKIDWLKSDQGYIVLVVLFIWKNLGYNMILFMAALASIPRDMIEVALLESANNFYIFFKIKIRYLSATILFVTIMSLINSFKIFREVYLLTGDYPYESMYMLQNFMNNMFSSMDYQRLSAAAMLISIVMVIIIGILFIIENILGKDVEG